MALSVLETALYAEDLAAAETFYKDVLGLEVHQRAEGRHVFFKLKSSMLLVFNPQATRSSGGDGPPIPPHGTHGEGHVCFRASVEEIGEWESRLKAAGVGIEAEVEWAEGLKSIYFRDPAGNSLEFAPAEIWDLA